MTDGFFKKVVDQLIVDINNAEIRPEKVKVSLNLFKSLNDDNQVEVKPATDASDFGSSYESFICDDVVIIIDPMLRAERLLYKLPIGCSPSDKAHQTAA